MCMCEGTVLSNLLAVIPGSWAMAQPIAQRGTVGVAPHHVPCTSLVNVQNLSASKPEKVKSTLPQKSATISVSRGFIHAKSRIGCWNVRSLESLSDQSAQLLSVIDTMKFKSIDLIALSESCW